MKQPNKKSAFRTPDRMLINTGHRTFDRQTQYITTGNIIANTQLGFFIRSYTTTTNGPMVTKPEGHMRDFDFNQFKDVPSDIKKELFDFTMDKDAILYEFRSFTWTPHETNKKIIHGYVITDYDYNLYRYYVVGKSYKSANIMREVVEYCSRFDGDADNFRHELMWWA